MSNEPVIDPDQTGDDAMHPMAKLLFGWVSHPRMGTFIFWGLAGLSAILILADPFSHRHAETTSEAYFGFYGFYGFVAFGFVVLMGWPLGKLLRRGEDYYGDAGDDEERPRERGEDRA